MCINVTDENNLDKFNSSCNKGNWFVWYFADWCGHCTEMNSEWENLKSNNVNNVNLAKVRDDFISKLKPEAPVQGYPTIILYKDGKLSSIYSGERNESAFNNFLSSNTDSSNNNNSVNSKVTETDSGIEIDLNSNTKSKKKSRKKRKSKESKKKASAKPKSSKKKASAKPKSSKKKASAKPKSSKKKASAKEKAKSKSSKKKSLENSNNN